MKCPLFEKKWTVWLRNACFLLLLIPLACTTMGKPKDDEGGLIQSVQAFHSALKWEDYKLASSWLDSSRREDFWNLADELNENVRVLDFALRDVSVDGQSQTGVVHIRCQYFHTRDPRLMSKTLTQRWKYLPDQKVWIVEHTDLGALLSAP